ncbi:MAG: hypothetical protein AB7O31_18110 [Burkholderiales bacterium]
MYDGAAIATLVLFAALYGLYALLTRLGRRGERAATHALLDEHLAAWRFPQQDWRDWCERERAETWNRVLRPALRYLPPATVLVAGLAWFAESRSVLSPGLGTLLVCAIALLAANNVFGPPLRGYLRLSRQRGLDYELYLGESGALEVWRDANGVRAMQEHAFTASGGRIERVEANGVAPAEIVFSIVQPLAFGFLHTEARFPVPAGRLAEARALARRLTPETVEPT